MQRTDLNQCHFTSDGKSACERLKRRQHRGVRDVRSCLVLSRKCRHGEVARGHVPGKTFHKKRRRWRCCQTERNEGDAELRSLEDLDQSRALRGPLLESELMHCLVFSDQS